MKSTHPVRAPRTARTAAATSEGLRTAYTSFVLFPDQLLALKQVAARQQALRGGKADQSAVVRELLDAIATGKPIPDGLKQALAECKKERPQE